MTKSDKTYEQLRAELDEVLLKLQDPTCDIEDALVWYEQGLKLSKQLRTRIEAVEAKIDTLST